MTVLIIERSIHINQRLKNYLLDTGRFDLIHQAFSCVEGLSKAESIKPDVVLLDSSLPDNCALELLRCIRTSIPACKVIALIDHGELHMSFLLSVSGANVILDKYKEFDKISEVISMIMSGREK